MKQEFEYYYKNGFVFIDGLLNLSVPISTLAHTTFF